MFVMRQPGPVELRRFLERAKTMPLTYPIGLARQVPAPEGYRVAEVSALLGNGAAVFERATRLLAAWRQFDLGWASVYPPRAPLAAGTNVVVSARHLGFWSLNACRVVYTLPDASSVGAATAGGGRVVGFAYGTLADHAETGEEIFKVALDAATGDVTYVIRAVSRERAWLARLGAPAARALQARFRRDSLAAMQRQIRG